MDLESPFLRSERSAICPRAEHSHAASRRRSDNSIDAFVSEASVNNEDQVCHRAAYRHISSLPKHKFDVFLAWERLNSCLSRIFGV
jgi:hypothetical protein